MVWPVSPNKKLLFWPLLFFLLINFFAWIAALHVLSQWLIFIATTFWLQQFVRKTLLLSAPGAVIAIRFQQDKFSILLQGRSPADTTWINARPLNGSWVSYWLIAIEWQQQNASGGSQLFWRRQQKYRSIITPSMFCDQHFRDLLRCLHLYRPAS